MQRIKIYIINLIPHIKTKINALKTAFLLVKYLQKFGTPEYSFYFWVFIL